MLDVLSLNGRSIDDQGTMGKHVMEVDKLLQANWHENDSVQENLKHALCEGAEAESGYVNCQK